MCQEQNTKKKRKKEFVVKKCSIYDRNQNKAVKLYLKWALIEFSKQGL